MLSIREVHIYSLGLFLQVIHSRSTTDEDQISACRALPAPLSRSLTASLWSGDVLGVVLHPVASHEGSPDHRLIGASARLHQMYLYSTSVLHRRVPMSHIRKGVAAWSLNSQNYVSKLRKV
jgi:hypothetical protein